MKSILLVSLLGLATLLAGSASAANTLTVDTTADTHSVGYTSPGSPNSTGSTDSGGHTSLRSALEFASTSVGTWTINLPAGTYNLSLGDLVAGVQANTTITIQGQGTTANTTINQAQAHRMVFVVNYNVDANVVFTLENVTVSGGNEDTSDPDGFGGNGGAILAGGSSSASGNAVTLNNVVFNGNSTSGNANGGAISMTGGGDLTVVNCSFSNNRAGVSGTGAGGAIIFDAGFENGNVTIQNSSFTGNTATGASVGLGGAIYLAGAKGNNTYTITACNFTGNTAGSRGGAIDLESGHLTASFNRITGNTAPATKGNGLFLLSAGAGWADVRNNWWGGNSGPNGIGGDPVVTTASASPPSSVPPLSNGQISFNPWITLANTASPGVISGGGATTMTASFLQNSSSQVLTAGQVVVLVGLPVTWNGAVHGSFGSQQTTIQANGQATAVFTNDGTCNDGSGNAVVDLATATAAVTVQCVAVTIASGLTANNKFYDGTTGGTLSSNNVVLVGILPADVGNVALSTNFYTATFSDINVGNGKTVTVTGLSLTGSAAGKYVLTPQFLSLAANITRAPVTIISGLGANNKIYDGTATASLSSNTVVLAGVLPWEAAFVALSTNGYTATFASPAAGSGQSVAVSGLTLTGSAAGNYLLVQPSLAANISAVTVAISSGLAANNKVYDGTAIATLSSNNVVLAGVLAGDVANVALSTNGYAATFASSSVGPGQSVAVSGLTLTGSAGGNYLLTQPTLVANISAATVSITSGLAADNKVYDGTTTASLSSNNVVLADVLVGDTGNIALSTNGYAAVFASSAVGPGQSVTVSGLTLTGSAAGNYLLTQPSLAANITGATVTIASGLVADNKIYDGTTTATLSSNNIVLAGVLGGDAGSVALSTNGSTAAFTGSAAGAGQSVTVSGLTLTGVGAGNYLLIQPSLAANITGAPVSVSSGLAAINRIYDGTPVATLSSNNVVLAGVLVGDAGSVALSTNGYTATFASSAVGPGQSVTVSGLTLTGSAAGNYSLTQPSLAANITGAAVTITSGLAANNKTYDGTATATLSSNSVVLAGILVADAGNVALSTNGYSATFASSAVGPGLSVTVSGLTLTGSAGGNYLLTQPGLAANITGATVTITTGLTANNKIYDGTATATLSSNSVVLTGILVADAGNVALSTNGYAATFASSAVGPGQSVTVSGLTLTGSAAGNYSLTQPILAANITGPPVTITSGLTANNKVYDGTTTATLSSNDVVLAGILAGDVDNVALSTNGYTATFASSAIGPGQSVTVSGLTLTGSAAGNYSLTQPSLVANITGAPVTISSGLTANNKVYDGTTTATLSSNNVVLAGVLAADVGNLALSTNGYSATFANSAAGTGKSVTVSGLTLTGSAAAYYALTPPVPTASISAAPLIVTANNATRLYGALNPSISGSVVGLQNGDVIIASFVPLADPTSPVGNYPISVSFSGPNSALANYSVTTNLGSLQVTPAPLTITASNATRLYGATNPPFTGMIAGVMNGDNITATYTCTADPTNAPGAYPIVPTLVSPANLQTNYQVSLVSGTLTIVQQSVVLVITQAHGSVTLSWSAIPGQQYQVQYTLNLSPINWINLVTITATNSIATASDSLNFSGHRFYRTVSLP